MNMNEFQEGALNTAMYPTHEFPNQGLFYTVASMGGEAGEVLNKVKKLIRGDKTLTQDMKEDLAKELGDVLWYVAASAHELGFDLETVAQTNLAKLQSRKERQLIQGDGDNR